MTRSLLLRALRHQGVLLGTVWITLFLFELLLVWVAARIDWGPGLSGLMEMFLPPDMREIVSSQFGLASFSGAVTFGFRHPLALIGATAFLIAAATTPAAERDGVPGSSPGAPNAALAVPPCHQPLCRAGCAPSPTGTSGGCSAGIGAGGRTR